MKKWFVFCLTLLLVFSLLTGCRTSDAKRVVGEWSAKADLAEAYKSLLAASDAAVAAHIDLGEFSVRLTLTFHSDGTYRLQVKDSDLEEGVPIMEEAIRKGLATYMQAETGKTMDNLLSAAGLTMDELMARYFGDDLAQVVRRQLESEGTFKVSGGKLFLNDQAGNRFFEGKYEVDKKTLKLKSGVTSNLIASLLPLELNRK